MPSTRTSNLAFAALSMAILGSCGSTIEPTQRQAAVAEAGAEVMPFDLDQTTHIFTDTDTGGIQDVVADNPSDLANIEDIRLHLSEEAAKFSRGDFSDPESIHGSSMPGLATLKNRFAEIQVTLTETRLGATLDYTTVEPELVDAIHQWFNTQASDHGSHAERSG